MSRDIDLIVEREEEIKNKQIQAARTPAKNALPNPNGYCFFCREKLESGERFCDDDCAADWNHERRMKKIY